MTLPANTGFPTNIPDPFGADPERQGDVHRAQDDALSLQHGGGLLRHRDSDDQPAGDHAGAVPGRHRWCRSVSVDGHPIYPSFAPKTDSDGNDIAGVRLARRHACLSRRTRAGRCAAGRRPTTAARDPASPSPFPRTAADRVATGDPRPSVAERYPTFDDVRQQGEDRDEHDDPGPPLLCEDGNDRAAAASHDRRDARRSEPAGIVRAVLVRAREFERARRRRRALAAERQDGARIARR